MEVGAKVICINDTFPDAVKLLYKALPKKDQIYVIRDVVLGLNWKSEPGEVCLYLIGLENPCSEKPPHPERGFNSERFRPLEEMQEESRRKAEVGVPVEV